MALEPAVILPVVSRIAADSILPRVNETQRNFARIDGFVVKTGIPKVGYGLIDDFGKELVH